MCAYATVLCMNAHEPPAGLYLPTSDLDVVVVGSGCDDVRNALKALANSLMRRSMAKNMQACMLTLDCDLPSSKGMHSRPAFRGSLLRCWSVAPAPALLQLVQKHVLRPFERGFHLAGIASI